MDWTKNFGRKTVGRKQVGRKLGARTNTMFFIDTTDQQTQFTV